MTSIIYNVCNSYSFYNTNCNKYVQFKDKKKKNGTGLKIIANLMNTINSILYLKIAYATYYFS